MQRARTGRARLVILAFAGLVTLACVSLVVLWSAGRSARGGIPVDAAAVAQSKDFAQRLRALRQEGAGEGAEGVALAAALSMRIERALAGEGVEAKVLQNLGSTSQTREERDAARRVVERVLSDGGAAEARELAAATRWEPAVDPVRLKDSEGLEHGHVRRIARLQSARLALALENRNLEEWATAYEQLLKLAALQSRGSTMDSALNSYAVMNIAYERARDLVRSGAGDEAFLARVQGITESAPPPTLARAIDGERIIAEDALDYLARTPDGALGGGPGAGQAPPRSEELLVPDGRAIGPGLPPRPEHISILVRAYEVLRARAEMNAAGRAADEAGQRELERLAARSELLTLLMPAPQIFTAFDQSRADFQGVRVMVALERYRLTRGVQAQALTELVPEFLPEVPVGPYAGRPLGYALRSEVPQGYVLWASGNDLDNDGGKVDFDDPYSVQRAGADGDFWLNR